MKKKKKTSTSKVRLAIIRLARSGELAHGHRGGEASSLELSSSLNSSRSGEARCLDVGQDGMDLATPCKAGVLRRGRERQERLVVEDLSIIKRVWEGSRRVRVGVKGF